MNNKISTISNLIWRFAERSGAQIVSFVVTIVLARILTPEDYGVVAIVTVFTSILQVFVDSGLAVSLIQKKDADDLDFSTVFYFNIFFCVVLYFILFLSAPLIADFYAEEQLTALIRVLGLTLIISGLKNVQQAYVSKKLLFKKFFYATLGGTIFSAILGIYFASIGFGVWAIVIQGLSNKIIDTIILWITVKWRPIKAFSIERLKKLYSFGLKILISQLLGSIYENLRQLIIGKMYSTSDLSFYNKGKQMPNLVITNINTSIDSVLLPVMSEAQNDIVKLKNMVRRSIVTSTYVIFPVMVGLAVCSESIILLLLTEKWSEVIPYMQIFCIMYAVHPMHTANLNALKAMGRSDLFLKLEIIKKVIGLIVLFSVIKYGPLAMAYSTVFTTIISSFINAYPNKKLIGYSYFEQIKDLFPSILLSTFMGFCIWWIQYLPIASIFVLIIQIITGVGIYVLGSIVFKMETFHYVLGTVKDFRKK
ncbi:MAG: lipopolysaccharide biosynthesis protein [Clostridia bacterium]